MLIASDIINFWFEEIDSSFWWKKDEVFDRQLKERFGELHNRAINCELFEWRETAEGRLAEIIVLDQFSRNIYRDSALAFANDPLALALAQEAIALNLDQQVSEAQRSFFYLPFMHSESAIIHQQAVKLYKGLGNDATLDFELKHQRIIDKFGRYPHRNKILGRESTPEEEAFLLTPNSSF